MADRKEIVERIRKDVDVSGTNLWVLMFAIFIASIGLNMNSTAVIIGAMLISPLMGPIMGIGLGVGTNDFDLIKRGLRNIALAAGVSVLTSTVYFFISPLHQAQSELLARTTPTIWDVFIALFGGLAGVVAVTRRNRSNVIPGVAIATALMPPLCTAGYGLATQQWMYFIGALYLFFINGVFITLSTYLIVRFLRFPSIEFGNEQSGRKVRMYITIVVVITLIPSVYLGYRIVKKTIFESNVSAFINSEFQFDDTQVLKFNVQDKSHHVEVFLVGKELTGDMQDQLQNKFKKQFPREDAELVIRQGFAGNQEIDLSSIRTGVIEDMYRHSEVELKNKDEKIAFLEQEIAKIRSNDLPVLDIGQELQAQYPKTKNLYLDHLPYCSLDSSYQDTILTAIIHYNGNLSRTERGKITNWLMIRTKSDTVKLIVE